MPTINKVAKPGLTRTEPAGLREARKRIRLLEQNNEAQRRAARYLLLTVVPGQDSRLVTELAAAGIPVRWKSRVLKLSGWPHCQWQASPIALGEVGV